ncbi:hypothetical protein KKE60_06710 [Patescibacteria group bacterium]|nr:hypothetical protein [Patescibacteria group bacterium]
MKNWREIYITDEGQADCEWYARLIGLKEYKIEHETWGDEEIWSVLIPR